MSISGNGGSRYSDPNGYDEPPPETGNRTQTDFTQQVSVKENRRDAFVNGSGR